VNVRIIEDGLSSAKVAALLGEHLEGMANHSPPESIHALDIDALRSNDITFWTAWDGEDLLGCGALKELAPGHGEIKSMRTASLHLGKGVATAILKHILDESRRRSYSRLSLETGSGWAFAPALALYKKFGFDYCGPFGDYRADSFSRCMTLELSDAFKEMHTS
jgi:putative acetyltransferase